MNKTLALCVAFALSTLTAGCSGPIITFSYRVVDPPPSGPRYLTTHCISGNNCRVITTNDDGSINR